MNPKKKLTSRERLLYAINHQQPDRIPIDLGGFQTGIHKKAYQDLLEHLGLDEKIEILDPVQQLAQPSEAVLQRFHVDTRYVCAHGPDSFQGRIEQNQRDGRLWHDLKDEFGIVWSMPDDQQLYMDISHHPLAQATTKDLADYPFPKGDDPTRFTGIRAQALKLRNESPYAICTGISGVVYEFCWYMRGLERWFIDTIENVDFCAALLDRTLKFWMDFHRAFLAELGDLVDVVMIGDDLAGQSGPLFSGQFYKKIVKPRQKQLVQFIKSQTHAKLWYHTCGNCTPLIPELIDNGIDILNPVQISADGMDAQELKDKFGQDITFWGGGCDSQHVLPFATADQVKADVKKYVEIFKPHGGYVFNNVHNIQPGIPAENIIAMFDAAFEFGSYES